MQKGFSRPLVLLLLAFCGALLFLIAYKKPSSSPYVKGVTSSVVPNSTPGFTLDVISTEGTWNVFVYLCENTEVCIESADSGKFWRVFGGGRTPHHTVVVPAQDVWKDFRFVKVFAKPGWGSSARTFAVAKNTVSFDLNIHEVPQGYDVLIFPTSAVSSESFKIAKVFDSK